MASISPIPTIGLTASTAAGDTPPITQILPILSQSVSYIISTGIFISNTLISVVSFLSYPILALSPLPLVLYAISPVVVLSQIILDALVFTPYRLATIFLGIIYPIYVLVGVACLTGAMLGISGRGVVGMLNAVMDPPQEPTTLQVEQVVYDEKPARSRRRTRSR
jgi:hypothetical protein